MPETLYTREDMLAAYQTAYCAALYRGKLQAIENATKLDLKATETSFNRWMNLEYDD